MAKRNLNHEQIDNLRDVICNESIALNHAWNQFRDGKISIEELVLESHERAKRIVNATDQNDS